MLITKEQQEYWIRNYVKEKHNNDEVIGFIDGIQRVMDKNRSLNPSPATNIGLNASRAFVLYSACL